MPDSLLWLPRQRLPDLLSALASSFERVLGPRVVDGAIQMDAIRSVADLPVGIRDDQRPGYYRLRETDSRRHFSWAVGPQGIKPEVFKASEPLWQVTRDAHGHLGFQSVQPHPLKTALIGVRACDLAALDLQDRHFLGGDEPDAHYAARRDSLFLVAVHCGFPADTCFCASTGDGPRARSGFDLGLFELDEGYVIEAGSDAGSSILEDLNLMPADDQQTASAQGEVARASDHQRRSIPSGSLFAGLFSNLDHPRWQETARRCLSCGNCTAVCPSCFCHKEFDQPALSGETSEHLREWDSCFSAQHSSMAGFQVRPETSQRYRQWLTHKLGSWHEQYGRSGCVGCGRCISWCPVGIDLTEEVAASTSGGAS